MSFGHLKLSETMRPWHTAGLRFLFPDNSTCETTADSLCSDPAAELPEEILQQLYAKVCTPCFSVWTYWELGEDLLLTPSQKRRTCLAALMRQLGWPKGSITFWPVAIPTENSVSPFVSLFWQTLAQIQPKLIVVFGRQAYSCLAPQKPYKLFHCEGTAPMLVPVPDLAGLDVGNELSKQTIDTLQHFRPCS